MTTDRRRARIGVIGAGWWCTRAHLPSLADYPRAELVGVADADVGRARAAGEEFGIPHVFDDHRRLLELDLDGVVIATPHDTHYALAKDALLAGTDVMVEKPMVVEPAHGRELVAIAAQEGRRLHIGYTYPHSSHAQHLRRVVHDGRLGDIHAVAGMYASSAGILYERGDGEHRTTSESLQQPRLSTYNSPERGGGQAHTQLTHAVSLLLFVTGLRPTVVTGHTSALGVDVDVVDAAAFRATTGAVGTVTSTGTVPAFSTPVIRLELFGSSGHAVYDMAGGTLDLFFSDGSHEAPPVLTGDARSPERQPSRFLADAFLDDTEVVADGELGLRTTEFICGLLRSSATGQPVQLDMSSPTEERRPS